MATGRILRCPKCGADQEEYKAYLHRRKDGSRYVEYTLWCGHKVRENTTVVEVK